MSVLSLGNRADRFAELLDSGTGSTDPTLGPMLAVVESLRAVPAAPAPEFRAALRQRLVAVAAVRAPEPAPAPAAHRLATWLREWRVQRALTVTSAGLAGAVAFAGVAGATSRSLPGNPLYGLKKGIESLQLTFTSGSAARGSLELGFARTRLAELRALQAGGTRSGSSVVATLRAMDQETLAGSRDLTAAYQQSGRTAPLYTLGRFVERQYAGLGALVPALQGGAHASGLQALQLLRTVDGRAAALLTVGTCAPSCTGTVAPGSDQIGVLPCTACAARTGGTRRTGSHGTGSTTTKPGTTAPTGLPTTTVGPTPGSSSLPLPLPTAPPSLPLPTSVPVQSTLPLPLPSASASSLLPSLPSLP